MHLCNSQTEVHQSGYPFHCPPAYLPSSSSIAAGQSNMQFSVQNGVNVSAELAAANAYPNIRLFTVGLGTFSVVPLEQLQTVYQPWTRASNTSVGDGAWGGEFQFLYPAPTNMMHAP